MSLSDRGHPQPGLVPSLARGVQRALTRLIFRPSEEVLLRDLKIPVSSEEEYVAEGRRAPGPIHGRSSAGRGQFTNAKIRVRKR
jgi:hypothetical protein